MSFNASIAYEVVAITYPWTYDMRQKVGLYENKDLADKVAALVWGMHRNNHPGGIRVSVEGCQTDLTGRISSTLDFDELAYLANLKFHHSEEEYFGMEP